MRTKICGITTLEQVQWLNELKPEYIGFVFAEKSKRFVTSQQASVLKNNLVHEIKSVGVFVNARIRDIISNTKAIDMIQLHGEEDDQYIKIIREYTDKPIIKAFSIQSFVKTTADFILIDSPQAGSGKVFDWNLLQTIEIDKPYFLAGGLTPENIQNDISSFKPP